MKPPHYGGPGILICEGHISESTFGDLIILDTYKKYLKLKGWTKKLYPMLIVDFIVHEELHKTQNQKGLQKLVKMVKTGELRNTFTLFKKYAKTEGEYFYTIAIHYYVCLFTYLWMKKNYGETYDSIIDSVEDPYYKFDKFIRVHNEEILEIMYKIKMLPPDVENYVNF